MFQLAHLPLVPLRVTTQESLKLDWGRYMFNPIIHISSSYTSALIGKMIRITRHNGYIYDFDMEVSSSGIAGRILNKELTVTFGVRALVWKQGKYNSGEWTDLKNAELVTAGLIAVNDNPRNSSLLDVRYLPITSTNTTPRTLFWEES